ncbi:MAG: UDP-N-acetylmuramate--L-alanine ligase [bacterium]
MTSFAGARVHLTGIKGSGMVALAQVLASRGADVLGTDTTERFYTDLILRDLNIPVVERFSADNIRPETRALFYSAAYDPHSHPEIVAAVRAGMPVYTYTQALGMLSEGVDATAVAGVHGKSTTTAILGTMVRALELPLTAIVGSSVPDFDRRAAWVGGTTGLIAETCEYRRHFLAFNPDRILVTSIEADHLDYYADYHDVAGAFLEFAHRLPSGGALVVCADDSGAAALAKEVSRTRPDVRIVEYGASANGPFRVTDVDKEPGVTLLRLAGFEGTIRVPLPGRHNALNVAGALALLDDILAATGTRDGLTGSAFTNAALSVASFRGLARRSERIGEASGVLVIDDYAHHPTAIEAELAALRDFYPGRRIVLDFMSHTYSRTEALLDRFARAIAHADLVILHKIYASAREQFSGEVTGRTLADAVSRLHGDVTYIEEHEDALEYALGRLRDGDIFLTMGAGNNWELGRRVLAGLDTEQSIKP